MITFKELQEKAVSKSQQRLMGMALAYKRGELDSASDEVKKLASSMSEKDLEDFAKTKHDNLPKKVEESLEIEEELSPADRKKKGMTMRRIQGRLKQGRRRFERRNADKSRLQKRANKTARAAVTKKVTHGRDKDNLSASGKSSVERRVSKLKRALTILRKKHFYQARKRDLV